MANYPISRLQKEANCIRALALKAIYEAGSGHPGASLSAADILTALFMGGAVRYNHSDPTEERRDRFILSAGHACPAYYALLSRLSFWEDDVSVLRLLGSPFQGHPSRLHLPWVETSTGSLGQGLSVGVGMGLAAQIREDNHYVFALTSDGEHDEGSVWEAAMAAAHYELGHFINIVDRNGMQIGGNTEEEMALEPLLDKYEAFGWKALIVDGHDYNELLKAISQAKDVRHQPVAIIARTIRGKGVSFMENKKRYHACTLSKQEYEQALEELEEKS